MDELSSITISKVYSMETNVSLISFLDTTNIPVLIWRTFVFGFMHNNTDVLIQIISRCYVNLLLLIDYESLLLS